MDGSNPETELVRELRRLAGAPEDATTFSVTRDDVTVDVRYSGGSSSRLTLSIPYDRAVAGGAGPGDAYRGAARVAAIRPMMVELRPESFSDQDAKEEGIDVEHQTGDEVFDRAVYIDAPSPGPLAHLFEQDARAAILELFELKFTRIWLDDADGLVRAEIIAFAQLPDPSVDTRAGDRALGAFVRLVRSLPPVSSTPGEHPQAPLGGLSALLWVLAAISFFAAPPIYFTGPASRLCSEDQPLVDAGRCFLPAVGGGIGGMVVGIIVVSVIRPMLVARVRGRSSSSSRINGILGAAFVLCLFGVGSLFALFLARH